MVYVSLGIEPKAFCIAGQSFHQLSYIPPLALRLSLSDKPTEDVYSKHSSGWSAVPNPFRSAHHQGANRPCLLQSFLAKFPLSTSTVHNVCHKISRLHKMSQYKTNVLDIRVCASGHTCAHAWRPEGATVGPAVITLLKRGSL